MTPEEMQKILDDAPDWAVAVNLHNGMYYSLREYSKGDLWLRDIRAEIAKHDTLDLEPADIPHGCIVLEK